MTNLYKINFLDLIKNNRKIIALITSSILLVCLVFTIFQPFLYSSSVSLLVIQRSSISMDAYSALRSSERIGDSLSQIVYTSTFFDQVMDSGYPIDTSVFSEKENKKREQWAEMVDTQVNRGTGLLKVSVYHEDKNQALMISKAVSYVLIAYGMDYVGASDAELRMVDSPLLSNWPVKPNVFLNIFSGLALGFLTSVVYVVLLDKTLTEKKQKKAVVRKQKPVKEQKLPEPVLDIDAEPAEQNQPAAAPVSLTYDGQIITMYDHLNN